MNTQTIEFTAAQLASCRRHRTLCDIDLGEIATDAEAAEIQLEALAADGHELEGLCVVGSSESVRHTLGLTNAVFSPIPADGFVHEGRPVRLPLGVIGAQCQLAFNFIRQFPDRNENTTREAVSTAIVAVRPAIGVFARRSRRVFRGDRPATADFAYHHLTVLGKTAEINMLEEFGCGVGAVSVNGARLHSFPFPSDPGHPLDVLCDLATRLRESQRQINAGDIVVVAAGPTIFQVLPSQEMTVDLGALGRVSCVFG